MKQAEAGRRDPSTADGDAERDAGARSIGAAEPRGSLEGRDHTRGGDEPAHGVDASGASHRLLLACAVLTVLGLAGHAHGGDGTAPATLGIGWAALLGAVQGVTEFLPISSDGHLALGHALLGIDPATLGHRFTITVHAGTLLAVLWTYRTDLIALAHTCLQPTHDTEDRRLLVAMLIASLPLGLVLLPGVEAAIIAMESQIPVVGVCLWVTALVLWIGFRHERRHPAPTPGRLPTPLQALLIGLAQVTAILPGVSRSGMTISTALLLGIDRAMAARFSFLISVIAVSGAVAKEGLGLALAPASEPAPDPLPYLVGFATSLAIGLIALRGLLVLVGRGRVGIFVGYLIVLGAAAIVLG